MKATPLERQYQKLQKAILNRRSYRTLLSYWSAFIRLRDAYECVVCGEKYKVSAHHIFRKCFIPEAQFETGNGITLCKDCHKEAHLDFNKKPDLNLPIGSEGGEKLELIMAHYAVLLDDAKSRGILHDKYYYVSDPMLAFLKRAQGYDIYHPFHGSTRLEEAYRIWASPNPTIVAAMLKASFPAY